jgi:DNA polymerase-4
VNSFKKYIAHLDLDCFFVSVERTFDSSLIGKPVVVGGSATGRGVVASASYEARKYGVRSAMPTGQALRLCPNLIVVRGRHGEYGRVSNLLYERVVQIAPVVERASIDEMNLDFTGCEHLYGDDLPGFMKKLQKIVWEEFKLPCTIALGSNKLITKIAANTVKPNGVVFVPHGTEETFLSPLVIDVIPGIGTKTAERLRRFGLNLVRDIQEQTLPELISLLGKHGAWIHRAAHGLGSTDLHPDSERKSISHEQTFGENISNVLELEKLLHKQVEDVCASMRKRRWKAKTITVKMRYADFKTISRAQSLKEPTHDDAVVFRVAQLLLREGYDRQKSLRLIGVRASEFVDVEQMDIPLFGSTVARTKALAAVDKIHNKFGKKSIHVGSA